jgi:hypothetical protein
VKAKIISNCLKMKSVGEDIVSNNSAPERIYI